MVQGKVGTEKTTLLKQTTDDRRQTIESVVRSPSSVIELCMRCKLVGYESNGYRYWVNMRDIPNIVDLYKHGQVAKAYCPPCKNRLLAPYGIYKEES